MVLQFVAEKVEERPGLASRAERKKKKKKKKHEPRSVRSPASASKDLL